MKPKRKDHRLGRLMQGAMPARDNAGYARLGGGNGDTDPQRFPAADYWKVQETEK